ncbi:GNAT family N-acetyltransferase [Hyphomonas johnsonii]|jgi:GNAT superfamily N-acetyltransferase|uniref:Acetyltransferase n=1 Tax=Hyphomonas johnsonii MHS-2 TaxID=1280950 RepID=A0A059FP16_9PROT|nr:GNAT family N-acetyltransferase [Hyphomonas johnsonii]KCZ92410.1 acetyltransferase [Hyphomonas johnsonii MHS-2]
MDDRVTCLRIFRDALRAFPWRGDWQNYLPALQAALANAQVLVAEEPQAGTIAFLTLNPASGYVDHLFVHADWRLCGVGRGLLEVARTEAGRPLILDVDAQNVAARDAYEAMGWRVMVEAKPAQPGKQIRLISP